MSCCARCEYKYPPVGDICGPEPANISMDLCSGTSIVQGYFSQDGEDLYRKHKITYVDASVFEEWYEIGSDVYNSSGSMGAESIETEEYLLPITIADVFALSGSGGMCPDSNIYSSWNISTTSPLGDPGYLLNIQKQEVTITIKNILEGCEGYELQPDNPPDGWLTEYHWTDTATDAKGPGVGVSGGTLDVPPYLEGNTEAIHSLVGPTMGICCNPRPIEDYYGVNQPPGA